MQEQLPKFRATNTTEVEQPLGEILGDIRAELQRTRSLMSWLLAAVVIWMVFQLFASFVTLGGH